jgi:hypothetical protein
LEHIVSVMEKMSVALPANLANRLQAIESKIAQTPVTRVSPTGQ